MNQFEAGLFTRVQQGMKPIADLQEIIVAASKSHLSRVFGNFLDLT
jgi:hypothetical protein